MAEEQPQRQRQRQRRPSVRSPLLSPSLLHPHSGSRLSNLTMYDVKQLYTAAKNYALNVSEIEAKVNEATSDDPWGASSTLMQEIAAATHNFQDFNEIMPGIYRNFMEREASEWRQIYKVRRCRRPLCGERDREESLLTQEDGGS